MGNELQQLQAVESMAPGMVLLKMENEQIFSIARAQPRDPLKIVEQLQALIDAYPAAADAAIYSRPVGTVIECTCGDCNLRYEVNKIVKETRCPGCDSPRIASNRKITKFAEGLSARAAESIRSIYGYTRLATTTELMPDGRARVSGVLTDYASGNVTSEERIVSPFYRAHGGEIMRIDEDRFLNLTVKAELAKIRRDVIMANTPDIIKAMFRDACERKMAELVAPEVIEQKIIPAFERYGITAEQLDQIIGRPHSMGWSEEERLELRKILNALKNEEVTARELLAGVGTRPTTSERPQPATSATAPDNAQGPSASDVAENQFRDRYAELTSLGDIGAIDREVAACAQLDPMAKIRLQEVSRKRLSEIRGGRGDRSNGPRPAGHN